MNALPDHPAGRFLFGLRVGALARMRYNSRLVAALRIG
ncbi:hypothetical protein Z948_2324 [Sulfitobacter donghicola DSW-25 = KCTC 12864 = JCM 14565]|nr:hypothetical protein Z948_2324 [Sulfitobacter donghicola DSW-25 = KCTC 12864 = JCM 14565]